MPANTEHPSDRRDESWWRAHMIKLRSQLAHDDTLCVPTRERVARWAALVATLPEPTPTVVNGKVYVGTANQLDVYGLL